VPNDDRRARLTDAVGRIRARAASGQLDRAFQAAGWVLVPLGVVLILLGWYGASHTTRVWQQIPYMISGGLLGVGLIFAGGFAYFAAWLTRLMDDTRRQSADALEMAQRTLSALERIEASLSDGAGDRVLVVAASGTLVHRPDCPMIAGRSDVRKVTARERGLESCKVCTPAVGRPRTQRKP
jgi:hypothetical protein